MRQGAGLVDHQRAHLRQRFERPAALDQDALLGGAGQSGHERDRYGEDERTWRRYHQHGDRADRIAAPEPGRRRERDGRREEHHGVAVGEARHRRPRALRGIDQADDARIGALGGAPRGGKLECLAGIHRSAHDGIARLLLHRHRFAGQRRLVEHREPFGDRAVDRHHVALAHHQPVAGLDRRERNLFQRAIAVAHGAAGHAGEQRGHLAAGATLGEALQVLPAGIHQGDHGGGEIFAECERRDHRQRGDDIRADIATAQADDDLDQEDGEHRERGDRPDRSRATRPAGQQGHESHEQAGGRPGDHDRSEKFRQI